MLTGTRPLARVTLRQDARNIAPWVGLISILSASSILAYDWIFTSADERAALASTLGANPALSLVFGPARNLMIADGFNAWRAGQLGALFAGVMAILIVVRNSRANEDSGQAELVASGVLARQSRLAVAVLLAGAASLALGVVCFALTVACGGGAAATLVMAASFTASGLMFAGVAAVAAQLGSDARTAGTLALAVLGICYVLRGYIDSSGAADWVSWVTPLGWLELARPATGNNPWPLLASLALAVALVAVAFVLQTRRDFGQGLIAARPGPAGGGTAAHVWGLAFRLNRGGLTGWLIGFAGLGLIFGNLVSTIGDLIANNPVAATIFASGGAAAAGIAFAFVVSILQIIAIIVAVMGVQIVLRVYSEETEYRVEPLLAGSLRRSTYLASNLFVALLGTALGETVAGIGLALVAHAKDHSIAFGDVVAQAVATVPAIWTLVALAVAVVGAVPSRRIIGWLGVVATFGLTLLGPTFKLPGWALDISPLRHVPNIAAAQGWSGLGWLAAAVGVFLGVGFVGYRNRNII